MYQIAREAGIGDMVSVMNGFLKRVLGKIEQN